MYFPSTIHHHITNYSYPSMIICVSPSSSLGPLSLSLSLPVLFSPFSSSYSGNASERHYTLHALWSLQGSIRIPFLRPPRWWLLLKKCMAGNDIITIVDSLQIGLRVEEMILPRRGKKHCRFKSLLSHARSECLRKE